MKNSDPKTIIEIEGVYLTEKLINQLVNLQNNENEGLIISMETIATAICFIASEMYMMNGEHLQIVAHVISDLSLLRDNFNSLRKP